MAGEHLGEILSSSAKRADGRSPRRDVVSFHHANIRRAGSGAAMAPALSSNAKISEVLLGMGIRADLLRDAARDGFAPADTFGPGLRVAEQGNDFELNRSQDVDEQLDSLASAGQLIVHAPLRTRVPSFEVKSPFGRDRTPNAIASQISPADFRNRERFIHALAVRDLDTIFDGGDALPLGQEDSLFGFIAAYRRLPVGKYATVKTEAQAVTLRTLATNNSTYAYIVNDSPWPVNVQMQLDLPPGCGVDELSGRRRLPVLAASNWTLPIEPFDLIAVKFRDPGVRSQESGCAAGSTIGNRVGHEAGRLRAAHGITWKSTNDGRFIKSEF